MVKVKRKNGARAQFISNGKYVEGSQTFEVSENVYTKHKNSLEKVDGGNETAEDQTPNYKAMKYDEVKAEAERRGLEVEGTGKDGNVVKGDYEKALEEDDQKE